MKGKAKAPRFQGAGTFVVNPTKLDNAYDEFVKLGLGDYPKYCVNLQTGENEDNSLEEKEYVEKEPNP